jgi:glutamate N-acetyltransferase/amino-acid N-acetyltransferase
MTSLLPAVAEAAGSVGGGDGTDAASAIMTTDTVAKEAVAQVALGDTVYTVGGMAKGAGMISPEMATMLAFITTDAPLSAKACAAALTDANEGSFARITVDGETSTNDCVLLMASGAAGGGPIEPHAEGFQEVAEAVGLVARELAQAVVRDGEGATTFVEIRVGGAASDDDAKTAAMAVADSLLFKCAVYGRDANWGRVVSAVGASRAKVDPERIGVRFAGIEVAEHGRAVPFDEDEAATALSRDEVAVEIDLGLGEGNALVWTCDLSLEYVRINADYRS